MHWTLLILLVFAGLLFMTSIALFIFWIILRRGGLPRDLLLQLDYPHLKKTSRVMMWTLLVSLALLGAGIWLILLNRLFLIFAGVVSANLGIAWALALVVINEIANHKARKMGI
jgi:hypothetical protein